METYCYGTGGQNCHVSQSNQGASGDFTTCIGLVDKVNNGSMETRVFDPEGDMPPSYSLSPTELTDSALQILKLWVNQGTSCDGLPTMLHCKLIFKQGMYYINLAL
jgi:hypothetical protein